MQNSTLSSPTAAHAHRHTGATPASSGVRGRIDGHAQPRLQLCLLHTALGTARQINGSLLLLLPRLKGGTPATTAAIATTGPSAAAAAAGR
jgi:hypothetical protein